MAFQQKKRNFVREPKSYPAAATFHRDLYDFDLSLADQTAWKAFFTNVRNLDGAALKVIAAHGPVTEEGLRDSLVKGTEWHEPRTFESDGLEVNCTPCGKLFQPVIIPWEDNQGRNGTGGNYRSVQKDEVYGSSERHIRPFPASIQERTEALTAEVLKDADYPEIPNGLAVRVVAECQTCKQDAISRGVARPSHYRTREGVIEVVFGRDAAITVATERREYFQSLQSRSRPMNQWRNRDNERRHEHEFVSWNRVLVEPQTATVLKAKVASGDLGNSAQALAALSETELVATGIVPHENAAAAVLRRARATVYKAGGQSQSAPRYIEHEAPLRAPVSEVNFSRSGGREQEENSSRRKGSKKGQRR